MDARPCKATGRWKAGIEFVFGLAAALALSRVVTSLIYGVRAMDPLTFAAVALLLLLVGVFATIIPAYRATRIEPVRILREE